MRYGRWDPILTGELAAQARASVDGIARALRQLHGAGSSLGEAAARGADGPWSCLLYVYLDLALETDDHCELVDQLVDRAIAGISAVGRRPSLYGGIAGVAWLVAHLARLGQIATGDEDGNAELDEALLGCLSSSSWSDHFELMNGLVGLGVYFLERPAAPLADECLSRIVGHLERLAERGPHGVCWRTHARLLTASQRAASPEGNHNLGMPHGIAGVIAFLAQLHRVRRQPRERALLEHAVAWLLAQPSPPGSSARFPAWITSGRSEAAASTLAWCYGDLGISVALLQAARAADDEQWEHEAIALARRAGRSTGAQLVRGTGLCHGAAGAAHLFNRLFQATGDAELKAHAVHWFERTLVMRTGEPAFAGYRAPDTVAGGIDGDHFDDSATLLDGMTGIGLALLAATSPVMPAWDGLLLAGVEAKRAALADLNR